MNRDIFAHFDQSGAFAYLFESHIGNLPPIPLADDGLPRTVKMQPMPTLGKNEHAIPSRDGSWSVVATESPVPSPLPAWRIRTVLRMHGLFDKVTAMINKLPEPPRIVVEEQMESSQFERNHPIIEQFGAELGLSSSQIDDLFREADELT